MGIPAKGESRLETFKQGLYSGIGWAIGVTVGFAVVSFVIVVILSRLGGIPVIGGFLANLVDATTQQLTVRSPKTPLTPGSKQSTPTPTLSPSPVDTE